jgi:SpoVK/Ycf46/Vps4 family AAA+-type ATPase
MTNKRIRINTPTRINEYNKFLIEMDKNSKTIYQDLNNVSSIKNSNKLSDDSNIKNELDKIIESISTNFKLKLLDSASFTGQSANDILIGNIEIDDPNYYKENKCCKHLKYTPIVKHIVKKEEEKKQEKEKEEKEKEEPGLVKEIINIDANIENISDILTLIDKYKLDKAVKYNINMGSLHNIKEPLEELNNMIGMVELKKNIIDQIIYFVQDLHKNKNTTGDFMHTVIYGPPGTGKTEIAKIMGKIYSKLGILSKGSFKKATRSDLIAGYLGQTALKTSEVIKECIGGVLFIDEAYALGNPEKKDSFAKECIDTLCEALSDNKDNLMVIIAGYETELKECFFNYNQGLDSRFTWRFKTDNYTAEDLYNIFVKKVGDIGWNLHEDSKITVSFFKKNFDYFKFFGRDIETILAKTKIAHSKRVFCKLEDEKRKITLVDLEKGFNMYLYNEDVKNRKDTAFFKKQLNSTIYC